MTTRSARTHEARRAQVFVEIVRYEGGEVVKRMGPMSRHSAEKVDDGANINLNHEQFFTRIVEAQP